MPEVILANTDLTVLGGPASIKVDLDFGADGKRGSYFFVGEGDPNEPSTVIGQTPQLFDTYINLRVSDNTYLYLYQYQLVDGQYIWVELVNLIPNHFSMNSSKIFVDGSTTINVPVMNISLLENLQADNFNIQITIANTNPVASSLSIGSITTVDDILVLPISVNAVEFSSNSWVPLDGTKIVHLFITVV